MSDARINITETMANLFGCHDDDDIIDKLCQVSDLAANVRICLTEGDIPAAAEQMCITQSPDCMGEAETNFWAFIEWEAS